MIHKAQEGAPLPDILMGLAFALARNYIATLIRGDALFPVVSLQGGVMSNEAVVHAFRTLLGLAEDEVVRPPHFTVLGAMGCAVLASQQRSGDPFSLQELKERAVRALGNPLPRSFLTPLDPARNVRTVPLVQAENDRTAKAPLVMGLDIGSVSVKGVVADATGRILWEDYRLSRSRPLETMKEVIKTLSRDGCTPELVAVTGSGRHLAGRLLKADLIVNEITAQARAAEQHDPDVDTVVEIGGQDSKWISLDQGRLKDFEMNRVCAAGTGSFLMEQADRLGIPMGREFSDAAFASHAPADLGTRCTVFMESDLIHHQNTGASTEDLAAGVCISIVKNYVERVATNRPIGNRTLFLGGVAAAPAVQAAFESQIGRRFDVPPFFRVSGALGAALKAIDALEQGEITPEHRGTISFDPAAIRREQFKCSGCPNSCLVDKYYPDNRVVFHGGLCDRWEGEHGNSVGRHAGTDLFKFRADLLDDYASEGRDQDRTWGMVKTPQYFEWFPFWKGYCEELGVSLRLPPTSNRRQFERGLRHLKVETCLPMKVMAGQIADLVESGSRTLFHPSILTEPPSEAAGKMNVHCPYIQASSQFFRGSFEVEWQEPMISYEIHPDSFRKEHIRFALGLGVGRHKAREAFRRGMELQREYTAKLVAAGKEFLTSLGASEQALIVLGKPYHTSDHFLNMNLGSLFQRLGIRAMPADLYPLGQHREAPEVSWKHQGNMIRVAREIAGDPRLFPVLITFFGCGPDPFTLRHVRRALHGKPLLVLEMDEHSSRAGVITRIEAFLERLRHKQPTAALGHVRPMPTQASHEASVAGVNTESFVATAQRPEKTEVSRRPRPNLLFMPYMADHSYGFAAAARSAGIDARVLPSPDQESEHLGRPHLVGGECHPYALILGDYLKLARSLSTETAERSLFYIFGPDACRLGQYPAYIDLIRREQGIPIGVISDVDQGLEAFGLSAKNRQRLMLRGWEGLNAYDLLMRLFMKIRPTAKDRALLDRVYLQSRDNLFTALSEGRVRQGMEDALNDLSNIPVEDGFDKPVVALTGDYYTRVVPFANNDICSEIERLGGLLWTPPTFSDAIKLGALKDAVWSVLSGRSRQAAYDGLLYLLMVVSEFRVNGGRLARKVRNAPLDLLGRRMWKSAGRYAHIRLPGGIAAPIVTALDDLDRGADGALNLITLNCSYGTVVTAVLSRELKERPGIPMLTLIFDGLKKTNEKTRLEAFMEQVRDRFEARSGRLTFPVPSENEW